jgi:hypothetical protein
MCNSNQTEETHSINLTSCIYSNKEITSKDSNSIFNLDVEPNQVHFIKKDQRSNLLVYRLRKSFYTKSRQISLYVSQKWVEYFAFYTHDMPTTNKCIWIFTLHPSSLYCPLSWRRGLISIWFLPDRLSEVTMVDVAAWSTDTQVLTPSWLRKLDLFSFVY